MQCTSSLPRNPIGNSSVAAVPDTQDHCRWCDTTVLLTAYCRVHLVDVDASNALLRGLTIFASLECLHHNFLKRDLESGIYLTESHNLQSQLNRVHCSRPRLRQSPTIDMDIGALDPKPVHDYPT